MKLQIKFIVALFLFVFSFGAAAPSHADDHEGMVFVKRGDGGFYIDKYLVTQEQYLKVIGINLSRHKNCPTCPVEQVNLFEATKYCRLVGKTLPSQQDWEYAATGGGKEDVWAGTSDEKEHGDYAWFVDNSGGKSHPVGQKKPNLIGLYDMSGNVWEWMNDDMLRGGSWDHDPVDVRTSYQGMYAIEGRYTYVGFRCVQY